jgi:hypothetical protein
MSSPFPRFSPRSFAVINTFCASIALGAEKEADFRAGALVYKFVGLDVLCG